MSDALWQLGGWTMLHFLWLGAGVAALGAVVRLACRRAAANARYVASLVTLAALAASPIAIAAWLIAVGGHATDLQPRALPGGGATVERVPAPTPGRSPGLQDAAPIVIDLADSAPNAQLIAPPMPSQEVGTNSSETQAAGGNPSPSPSLRGRGIELASIAAWLPWAWIVGTPITFALLATGLVGSERLRRKSTLLTSGPAAEACERLRAAMRIGRRVSVAACDGLAQPVLVGIVRPLILLPASALSGWTPAELEMVLLHELAHVRRWDNLVNLLQRIVESLLFFHPAVWLVSGALRRDREECCDAIVVSRTSAPQRYAELLVSIAAKMQAPQPTAYITASAMADHALTGRIRRILKLEDEPMWIGRRTLLIAFALPLLLSFGLFCSGFTTTSAEAEEPPFEGLAVETTAGDNDEAAMQPRSTAPDADNPTASERSIAESEDDPLEKVVYDVSEFKHLSQSLNDVVDGTRLDPYGLRLEFEWKWVQEDKQIEVTATKAAHEAFRKALAKLRASSKQQALLQRELTDNQRTQLQRIGRPGYDLAAVLLFPISGEEVSLRVRELNLAGHSVHVANGDGFTALFIRGERTLGVDEPSVRPTEAQAGRQFQAFTLKYARAPMVTLNLEEYFEKELTTDNPDRLKFIWDSDTNSIVVQNASPDQLGTIRDLIQLYDQPTARGGSEGRLERLREKIRQMLPHFEPRPDNPMKTVVYKGDKARQEFIDHWHFLMGGLENRPEGRDFAMVSNRQKDQVEISAPVAAHKNLFEPIFSGADLLAGESGEYRLRLGDRVKIEVVGAFPEQPIDDVYTIEPMGTVPLGATYGRAKIAGMTVLEAEAAVKEHLKQIFQDVEVQLTLESNRRQTFVSGDSTFAASTGEKNGQANYLYDGKTFEQWRDQWRQELKAENRIEAINAMAEFARAGRGRDAAEAILEVAAQYDFDSVGNDPEGKVQSAIIKVLAGDHARVSQADWLPALAERMEADPKKWRMLSSWLLNNFQRPLEKLSPEVRELFMKWARDEKYGPNAEWLSALLRATPEPSEELKHLVRQTLRGKDAENALNLLRVTRFNKLDEAPEQFDLLFHSDNRVRYQARTVLSTPVQMNPQSRQLVFDRLTSVLDDEARQADHAGAVRALGALAIPKPPSEDFGMAPAQLDAGALEQKISQRLIDVLKSGDASLVPAAAAALYRLEQVTFEELAAMLAERLPDDRQKLLKAAESELETELQRQSGYANWRPGAMGGFGGGQGMDGHSMMMGEGAMAASGGGVF